MDRKDRTLGNWSLNWEDPFRISQLFSNNAYEIAEVTIEGQIPRINYKYLKKYKPML